MVNPFGATLGRTTLILSGAGALALAALAAPPQASAHKVTCGASGLQPTLLLDIPFKFVLGRGSFACNPTPPDISLAEVCLQYASTKTAWATLQCSKSSRLSTSWPVTTSYPCPSGVTRTYRSRAILQVFHGTWSTTPPSYSAAKTISC